MLYEPMGRTVKPHLFAIIYYVRIKRLYRYVTGTEAPMYTAIMEAN